MHQPILYAADSLSSRSSSSHGSFRTNSETRSRSRIYYSAAGSTRAEVLVSVCLSESLRTQSVPDSSLTEDVYEDSEEEVDRRDHEEDTGDREYGEDE